MWNNSKKGDSNQKKLMVLGEVSMARPSAAGVSFHFENKSSGRS